jgi:hypothetical protein
MQVERLNGKADHALFKLRKRAFGEHVRQVFANEGLFIVWGFGFIKNFINYSK